MKITRRVISGLKVGHNVAISLYLIIISCSCVALTSNSSKSTSGNNSHVAERFMYNGMRSPNIGRNPNTAHKVNAKNGTKTGDMKEDMDLSSRSEWSLQFDPSYFATLNAANHRPVELMNGLPSTNKPKVNTSSQNLYYYSPETYGKATHKNHQTGSFAYLYPSSSTTSTSTTTPTTPTPKMSNNRYGEVSSETSSNDYNEAAPDSYSTQYNPSNSDKQSAMNYNYEDEANDDESNYDDSGEQASKRQFYTVKNKNRHIPLRPYYGSDLTSLPTTNDNMKSQPPLSSPIVDYGSHEDSYYEPSDDMSYSDLKYGSSASSMKFPPKYYADSSSYYPSYYPSRYYPSTYGHTYSEDDSLSSSKSSWLGPGIAGLLLGFLPLGMLLASMVPAMVSMPIVSTATVGRRKRDTPNADNYTQLLFNPLFDIIAKYGTSPLDDINCLQEMFCTFSVEGKKKETNLIQRFLYTLAEWTPVQWATSFGVNTLFNAVKTDKCQPTFECSLRKVKSSAKI